MTTNATIATLQADTLIAEVAHACNTADAMVQKAPFASLADILVTLPPHEVNAKMYALIGSCLTSGSWGRAKENLTKALRVRGFEWKSSGPHFRTRDDKKKPFILETKAEKTARVNAEEAAEADEQAKLQATAEAQRQYERELRDRETTVDDLVNTLLSECERLGLDKSEALAKLTAIVSPKRVTVKPK